MYKTISFKNDPLQRPIAHPVVVVGRKDRPRHYQLLVAYFAVNQADAATSNRDTVGPIKASEKLLPARIIPSYYVDVKKFSETAIREVDVNFLTRPKSIDAVTSHS